MEQATDQDEYSFCLQRVHRSHLGQRGLVG
jgi:hypothetical protein